jgi:hypothetical protein
LSIVPSRLERIERLQPPDCLDLEQAAVWVAIVDGHPADWFDAGAIPVLTQLCRHVAATDRIARMVRYARNHAALLALLVHQRAETEQVRKLSVSLRLTPQSLINHNGNKKPLAVVSSPHTRTHAG